MKMESMYEQLGVSAAVYEYGERIIAELRDRFDAIDGGIQSGQGPVRHAEESGKCHPLRRHHRLRLR